MAMPPVETGDPPLPVGAPPLPKAPPLPTWPPVPAPGEPASSLLHAVSTAPKPTAETAIETAALNVRGNFIEQPYVIVKVEVAPS
jgi:hypothetical protein